MIPPSNICSLSKRYKCNVFTENGIDFYKNDNCMYGIERSQEVKCTLLNLSDIDRFKLLCIFNEFYFLNNKGKIAVLVSDKTDWNGADDLQPFECDEAIRLFPDLSEISIRVLSILVEKANFEKAYNPIRIVPNSGFMHGYISDNYEFFFSPNYDQINSTISTLEKANYVSVIRSGNNSKILTVTLTEEGFKKGNQQGAKKRIKKCFVAMKFGKMSEFKLLDSIGLQYIPSSNISKLEKELKANTTLTLDYENYDNDRFWKTHIKNFIEKGFGIDCVRVDESCRNGEIPTNIKELISESDFVICDLSYNNNGVYYEAGYAHALNKEIIFICKENHLPLLHFDLRNYNVLCYRKNEMSKFKSELGKRINELLNK